MTADTPAAPAKATLPTKPGYYWAKWRIAADGTHEGDDLTPSDHWELVEVNDNNGEPGSNEQFSVAVPGVRETQWPDCFVWGDFVAPLAGIEKAHPPSNAAHVAALTTQLEAERARNANLYATQNEELALIGVARDVERAEAAEALIRETARADAAEKEAKALKEALEPFAQEADRLDPLDYEHRDIIVIADNCQIWQVGSAEFSRSRITYGDLRKARATLAQPGEGETT